MNKLIISFKDWVKCNIQGLLPNDKSMLVNEFKIFVPAAKFMPTYKMGIWDGHIRFFELTGSTYVSLLPEILGKINLNNYESIEYKYPENFFHLPEIDIDDLDINYMSNVNWYKGHRLEGQPVILEDHQLRVAKALLKNKQGIVSSCTGSGKTLLSAVLFKKLKPYGKSVIIVPSKDLAIQSVNEYKLLGFDAGIVGCGFREFGHDISVCTWQTISSINKKSKTSELSYDEIKQLKENVVCLICDECHTLSGAELQKICLNIFNNVPLRFGLTGTIPKQKCDYYNIVSAIGSVIDEKVTAKELQDKGFLSSCNVSCLRLADKTICMDYPSEVEYLSTNDERLTFIANFISQIVKNNNNTLVLVGRIKMGEILEEKILKNDVDSIFLNGSVKSKKRFEEYESIKTENNRCLICTDKIASTGLNIPRLYNLVFIDFGKSFTKVIQSIGRGLRKASDKDHVDIFDISSTTRFSKKHFNDRIHFYEEAEYPYKIFDIPENGWKYKKDE